jgi:arylsulfatase A-like enzyme
MTEGVRTGRYKLIYFNELKEWELYDLQKDPHELHSVYDDPAYADVVEQMKVELQRLKDQYKDDSVTGSEKKK